MTNITVSKNGLLIGTISSLSITQSRQTSRIETLSGSSYWQQSNTAGRNYGTGHVVEYVPQATSISFSIPTIMIDRDSLAKCGAIPQSDILDQMDMFQIHTDDIIYNDVIISGYEYMQEASNMFIMKGVEANSYASVTKIDTAKIAKDAEYDAWFYEEDEEGTDVERN